MFNETDELVSAAPDIKKKERLKFISFVCVCVFVYVVLHLIFIMLMARAQAHLILFFLGSIFPNVCVNIHEI